MINQLATSSGKRHNVRWLMLAIVSLVVCLNYLDRANLAVAAPVMSKELGLTATAMGLIFSAFTWSYAFCLPFAGVLIDKYGSRLVYTVAIVGWSAFTGLMGTVNSFATAIGFRLGIGAFESPALPISVRSVTAWHPTNERGLAVGCYTGAEYIGLSILTPVLTFLLVTYGWQSIFYITGVIGLVVTFIWHRYYRDPQHSKILSREELEFIKAGGGLGDTVGASQEQKVPFSWKTVGHLLGYRQIWGLFIGTFAVSTILVFFLTWFPSYLINAKGLSIIKTGYYAAIPFVVAIFGTLLGGKWSDWMINKGYSLSAARKVPIIVGLILCAVIILANYTNDINLVILCMSISYFGQAIASTITGSLLGDIAPVKSFGLTCGMYFFASNVGALLSPIVVGLIVDATGHYDMAIAYISTIACVGVFAFLFIVGKVYRIVIP